MKQTIAQVEARKRKLLLRLRRDANELVKLEDQLKDMRTGKRKVAPPKPHVTPILTITKAGEPKFFDDRIDDMIRSTLK